MPVVPRASRYVAAGTGGGCKGWRWAARGTRSPFSSPVRDSHGAGWAHPRRVARRSLREGGTALAVLVSYWLLYGGLAVTPGFLVGAGLAQRSDVMVAVRRQRGARPLVLTPTLGWKGLRLPQRFRSSSRFRCCCAWGSTLRVPRSASWRAARWVPAYSLGLVLAGLLFANTPGARAGGARRRAADRRPRSSRLLERVLRARAGRGRAPAIPRPPQRLSRARTAAARRGRAPRLGTRSPRAN